MASRSSPTTRATSPSRSSRTTSSPRRSTAHARPGVAYFVAAGNDGQQSWEGTYNGGAGSQDFDPSQAATDTVQTVGNAARRRSRSPSCCSGPSRGATRRTTSRSTSTASPAATPTLLGTMDIEQRRDAASRRRPPASAARAPRARLGIAIRRVAGTGTPVPQVHRLHERRRHGGDRARDELRRDRPGRRVGAAAR